MAHDEVVELKSQIAQLEINLHEAKTVLSKRMNDLESALRAFLYAETQSGAIEDPYYRLAFKVAKSVLNQKL